MKKTLLLPCMLVLCVLSIQPFSGHSFLTYRSQGINGAREIVGWQRLRNDLFADLYDDNLSLALEYTRSFNTCALNNYFFGGQSLTFSGSRVANRGACDVLADYFGLPTDFQSRICFNPRIQNVIADFDWYWSLHDWLEGFFFHIRMPLTNTRWNLQACEYVQDVGMLNYPGGYMSMELINRDQLPRSALQTLSGNVTFGDLAIPLEFGKICGLQKKTGLADIYVGLGYTFTSKEHYHVGCDIHTVIPTGTHSTACTLFEPQFGNGGHWALGASLTAHYDLWSSDDNQKGLSIYCNAQVQHLFRSNQVRSYDFKNGPGSRYMLLESLAPAWGGIFIFPDTGAALTEQYNGRLSYAINETTFNSVIKIDVQADITFKLSAYWHNWQADLGYNFWVRTQEKLVCRERLPSGQFAIKGDAQLYGFNGPSPSAKYSGAPINATQSQATLHAGQGVGNANLIFDNANADNASLVVVNPPPFTQPLFQATTGDITNTGLTPADITTINGSQQAILLTDCDINNCSGLSPRGLSNKLFGHIDYTWYERSRAVPYLGIGGEAEFAGKTNCLTTAVSQWGVWIKGGITY
jgi:hypothetical protein